MDHALDASVRVFACDTPPRAILFDFDGTLASLTIDFVHMRERIAELALEYAGRGAPPAGQPVLEWMADLSEGLRARPDHGAAAAERFLERCHERIRRIELEAALQGQVFEFTRELLGALRRAGASVAILTRNCREAVYLVFPDIERHCDCLLARDDVRQAKPHPGHLRQALRALTCDPGAALLVGDHPLDIRTGRNAGVPVASGRTSLEELRRNSPDYLARDCRELFAKILARFA